MEVEVAAIRLHRASLASRPLEVFLLMKVRLRRMLARQIT